jgi:hypothetical protein
MYIDKCNGKHEACGTEQVSPDTFFITATSPAACKYVCVYLHIYLFIYFNHHRHQPCSTHILTQMLIHRHTHILMMMRMLTGVTSTRIAAYTYTRVSVYIYMYIYTYIHISIYLHKYVYTIFSKTPEEGMVMSLSSSKFVFSMM